MDLFTTPRTERDLPDLPTDDSTPQPSPTASQYDLTRTAAPSYRSRASSIFSTGTGTSITTLPGLAPPEASTYSGPIDVLLGQRNFRITARPGSILSISSFDYPAPPYSEASASTSTLTEPTPTSPTRRNEDSESPEISQPTPTRPIRGRAPSPLRLPSPRSRSVDGDGDISPPSPPLSPISSTTNALSQHYTTVVRTIDTNHQLALSSLKTSHAMELSRMHDKILEMQDSHMAALDKTRHDIDTAYRAHLKDSLSLAESKFSITLAASLQELEDVKKAMLSLESSHSSQIEKLTATHTTALTSATNEIEALRTSISSINSEIEQEKQEVARIARNQVEDLWEGRWKDRMKLAAEEIRKVNGERDVWEGVCKEKLTEEVFRGLETEVISRIGRGRRRSGASGGT